MNWKRAGRRLVLVLLLAAAATSMPPASAQQPAPKPAQDEFVPIDQLPADERVPAAGLLITAYAFAWVVVAGYLFSIWRRLGRVERDIAEATRRLPGSPGRPGDARPR